ncbi:hypothetical protein [Thiocystis violacea]|uniref:hypothetical protein n=1 Tax=Thiocystis violacea TaxID=13725 RepID=UPI0019030891|nr:hypothetical protein [Thiocystis violacea]
MQNPRNIGLVAAMLTLGALLVWWWTGHLDVDARLAAGVVTAGAASMAKGIMTVISLALAYVMVRYGLLELLEDE